MDVDNDKKSTILPEIDIYLHLNVIIFLLDKNDLEKVRIRWTLYDNPIKKRMRCIDMYFIRGLVWQTLPSIVL